MESDNLNRIADFVRESNGIEGIIRDPTADELAATADFLVLPTVVVANVAALVKVYQPNAVLRDQQGLDVRVGNYVAPRGGIAIRERLRGMLESLPETDPWEFHVQYEGLHPFTDGNGRSGRALWAWQMMRRREGLSLGFLHRFYYQTLDRRQ